MHECTSIIIKSFHLFQLTFFNKGFVVEGEREALKKRMITKKGRQEGGVKAISMLTQWKIFKQQIEFLLITCLVVAEGFLKRCRYFFSFFVYGHVNIFIVAIYICVKKIAIFYVEITKNDSFLSSHSSFFHSRNLISILHVKWAGMNKGEQVENLKFWLNILFK